jgi:hypothetical protein
LVYALEPLCGKISQETLGDWRAGLARGGPYHGIDCFSHHQRGVLCRKPFHDSGKGMDREKRVQNRSLQVEKELS